MESKKESLTAEPRKEDSAAWKTVKFLESSETAKKYPDLNEGWLFSALNELLPACPSQEDLFADRGNTVGAESNENLYYTICAAQETLGVKIDGILGPQTYLALKHWQNRKKIIDQSRSQRESITGSQKEAALDSKEILNLDKIACFGASLEVGMMSALTKMLPGSPLNKAEKGASSEKILSKIQATRAEALNGSTVIYSGGIGNDIPRGTPVDRVISNMENSINLLLEKGASHVFIPLRVPYPAGKAKNQAKLNQINTAIRASFSNNPRITLIEVPSTLVNTQGTLNSSYDAGDGIHLNSSGYSLYAEEVKRALSLQS